MTGILQETPTVGKYFTHQIPPETESRRQQADISRSFGLPRRQNWDWSTRSRLDQSPPAILQSQVPRAEDRPVNGITVHEAVGRVHTVVVGVPRVFEQNVSEFVRERK